MKISFDAAKNERNVRDRGLPFALVARLDWSTALIEEDLRRDYGERRFRVFGFIDERLHVAVFTPRSGDTLHVISLRKANSREAKHHAQATQP